MCARCVYNEKNYLFKNKILICEINIGDDKAITYKLLCDRTTLLLSINDNLN